MIIRVDPVLKDKASRLAKKEGKTLDELVREPLEKYWQAIGCKDSAQS